MDRPTLKRWLLRALAIFGVVLLATWLSSCGAFFVSENEVASIALSPANATVQVGDTEQYVATGTKGNGDTLDVTPAATWISSDQSVATINSAGLATSIAAGTTKITAQYERAETDTFLTVTSATLSSIAVTPANPTIAVGATQQFVATGTYSDSSTRNIISSVTWSSNYENVATITSAGYATAVAKGSTIITATKNSISYSTVLTVD